MWRPLVITVVGLAAVGATGCSDEVSSPTTGVAADAVTVTTSADADPLELGEQILLAAGARDAVASGQGAEERLTELAVIWCETAGASDVENADATFRYSLNEFFTTWGRASADGEVQDLRLALALLAGEFAAPLAVASNDVLCPEVERP